MHGAREHQFVYGFEKAIPRPISFVEIDAYRRVMGCDFDGWEIALIRRLDSLFRNGEFHPIEFEPPGQVKNMMQSLKARGKKK